MSDPASTTASDADPLAPPGAEQEAAIERAAIAARRLDGALTLASFNGWGAIVMATLSAMFLLLSPGVDGVVVALGLAAYGVIELRGRAMLARFDERAPKLLAWNQVMLIALVAGYCAFRVYMAETGRSDLQREFDKHPELREMIDIAGLEKAMTRAVYATLIVVVLAFQGNCARVYLSKRAVLRELATQTPAWALRVVRAARR